MAAAAPVGFFAAWPVNYVLLKHELKAGRLYGVFARKAGTVTQFKYSKAMQGSGIVWDEATLDKFLTAPRKLIPKTKKAFGGLEKKSERDNLIAYLKEAAKAK